MLNLRKVLLSFTMTWVAGRAQDPPVPVLVELFTSEGCSSCPAADDLLVDLVKRQSEFHALILPLEFHVDYFNQGGWKDRFSEGMYTRRQIAYARAFKQKALYTPEMVVGGAAGIVGSDPEQARSTIADASKRPSIPMEVEWMDGKVRVHFQHMPSLPGKALVYLAVTEDGLSSRIGAGENAGLLIHHGAVVRQFSSLGPPKQDMEASIHVSSSWRKERLNLVALLQDESTMRVLGVATCAFGNPAALAP